MWQMRGSCVGGSRSPVNPDVQPFLESAMHGHAFAHAASFPGRPLL